MVVQKNLLGEWECTVPNHARVGGEALATNNRR
jgi:hypothetical protein